MKGMFGSGYEVVVYIFHLLNDLYLMIKMRIEEKSVNSEM